MEPSVDTKEPALGVEEQSRIVELYDRLDRLDHYTLLGVAATDDTKTIKRAYLAKAKAHHPDRFFRKDIGALRPKIEAIFAALTAAESTLSSKTKRAAYDEYLREVLKTRMNRRQGLALEAERKWQAAAETWRRVVEKLPTDAYVQHRYAYALLRAGVDLDAARAAALRAIDLDGARAEYRLTAACVHLAENRDRSALAQLAIACELDPDRADVNVLYAALGARVGRRD